MRPLKFPAPPANQGLVIGNSVMQGLNSAINNFARMKMQKAQMQYHQAMAQGMNAYRQAQAESLQRKSADADMSRVNLAFNYSQFLRQKGNPDAADALLKASKPALERMTSNMPQDMADQLNQHVQQQIQQGQFPQELSGELNLNPNEMNIYKNLTTSGSRENVANTQAGARIGAANIYAGSRTDVANIGAKARVQAAQIGAAGRPNVGQRADLQSMKNLTDQMKIVSGQLGALDKPAPFGTVPIDDATKNTLRQKYQQDLADLHQQYSNLHTRLSGGQGGTNVIIPTQGSQNPATAQPGQSQAAPQGRYLPKDQWQQAQPGDYVQHPSGQGYVQATGRDQNGPIFNNSVVPGPQAPAAPAPAPAANAPVATPPVSTGGATGEF